MQITSAVKTHSHADSPHYPNVLQHVMLMLWHQVLIHDIDTSSGMEEIDDRYSVASRIDDMIGNFRLFW